MTNNKVVKIGRGRPAKSRLDYSNAQEALLRSGIELLTEKGFNGTGLDEILKRVNVPKGSFYHYFENKEAFGCAVIDNYSDYFVKKLKGHLVNSRLPALEALYSFMEDAMQGMERFDYKRGCLIGNMAQELGSSNEKYRVKLESVFRIWQKLIANCLNQAKQEGTLSMNADSDQLANFFWIGWEGAVMHSKLTQNKQPMELFAEQFFALLPR